MRFHTGYAVIRILFDIVIRDSYYVVPLYWTRMWLKILETHII